MHHILYHQSNCTLSFTTNGMCQFYNGPIDYKDIINTTEGIGKYKSCFHLKNLRVVPTMYAQIIGKSVSKTETQFTIRDQRHTSGFIVSATYHFDNDRLYVHAIGTLFGPHWNEKVREALSPVCIIMHGWAYSSLKDAIDGISRYFDKILSFNYHGDYRARIRALQCDLEVTSIRYDVMFGSKTVREITPWSGLTATEVTEKVETMLRTALASYDDTALMNQALESYQLDLGITKELVDTALGLKAVKSAADVAAALLPNSPHEFKNLKQFADYLASSKLWFEYGFKLPLQTLDRWSTALKPEQIAKYCLSPGELRSGVKHVSSRGQMLSDPEDTLAVELDTRLGLGLKPRSDTIEFINSLYRYGILMNLAGAWDLIPLSFAIDWVTTLPKQVASKLSTLADYWRFEYSYAKRTWKGRIVYTGPYTISFDIYIRSYSRDIPKLDIDKQITLVSQEGIKGSISLSSLDEAVSLITVFS